MNRLLLLLLSSCFMTLAARDVVLVAKDAGHTAFHDAVQAADLYKHAKKKVGEDGSMAPFTVFVPTNAAFAKIATLPKQEQLGLIPFHVVPGQKIESLQSMAGNDMPTVGEVLLQTDGTNLNLADSATKAKIVGSPLPADNGIVYVIDTVLLPEGTSVPAQQAPKPKPAPVAAPKAPIAPVQPIVAQQSVAAPQPVAAPLPSPTPAPVVQAAPMSAALSSATDYTPLLGAVTQLTQAVQQLTTLMLQQRVVVEQVPTPAQSMAVPVFQAQPIVVQ